MLEQVQQTGIGSFADGGSLRCQAVKQADKDSCISKPYCADLMSHKPGLSDRPVNFFFIGRGSSGLVNEVVGMIVERGVDKRVAVPCGIVSCSVGWHM